MVTNTDRTGSPLQPTDSSRLRNRVLSVRRFLAIACGKFLKKAKENPSKLPNVFVTPIKWESPRDQRQNGDFVLYSRDQDRLNIRSFHLRFSISSSFTSKLPETLTLVYLPRINGNHLEINGSKIRADLPSFVALYRARSMEQDAGEAVYASVDRVRVGEAVRFEAYVGSQRAIKGLFRRTGGIWGLECKSPSEFDLGRVGISGAEILVGGERGVMMREKVEKERRRRRDCLKLEEIVEEGEREGCDCCCEIDDEEDDDGEEREWEMVEMDEEEEDEKEMEEEEGMKWAMEMGIWVMCVGVGYLVSKASYERLRKKRFF